MHTAIGVVALARNLRASSEDAAQCGTRLTRRGYVQAVGTSGGGLHASAVMNGRFTQIGMKTTKVEQQTGEN